MRKAELFRQNEGFCDADHGNAEDHVVADLCRLTRAIAAAMDNLFAHGFKDRFPRGKGLIRTADHECKRTRRSPRRAA
ncbi:hypothetical protein D3C71_1329920 [compost metagenome]